MDGLKSWRKVSAVLLAGILAACGAETPPTVVVYTALDEPYARPILDAFEERTGIAVLAVYDSEASKTTGLVNRLLAERTRPRADVFWNNEVAQTIRLQREGILAPYVSPEAEHQPGAFKDSAGYWTGFAARARVIIYNTELVEVAPRGIEDLLDPRWKGQAAIARPLFGTTATHAGALFALWGDERARAYFEGLLANDVAVLTGNATVRDLVARGQFAFGLTDTDDAHGGVLDGFPVRWVFPDQGPDEMGTLLIPNTVALIAGAPNPEGGKALIDFLLSAEVEERLARGRSLQIPLNPAAERPENVPDIDTIRTTPVRFEDIATAMPAAMEYAEKAFIR